MKKLLASSMGNNEKVNSNKLFCTLKISKGLIEYVQKKNKIFFVPVLTDAGTPVWWYTFAPAVHTFLTQQDLSCKTVYPFATNGGWIGHTFADIEKSCKGAEVKEGMNIRFDEDVLRTSEAEIDAWIQKIAK